MVAVLQKKTFRDFDWLVAALAILIVAFGVWEIRNAQPTETYWQKQIIGLAIALVAMLAIAFSDYRRLVDLAPIFYIFGLLLLVIVLVPNIGVKVNGQRCWIQLGPLGRFQPSEFMKIPVVLMLAKVYGKHRTGSLSWKEALKGAIILLIPLALILLEPDTGQAITYLPLLGIVLFLSSVRMWIVAAVLAACIIGAPAAYAVGVKTGILHGYKLERINVILDPENADKRGFGYHTWQSIVTVGAGGVTGTRDKEFSQSSLKFLPEPHTDFIFAVTAETTGFIGCILLLASYALLLTRLITDARRSRDRTGMLVIMAIVGGLIFQISLNVGMAVGLLPVIGVPLPLMSAGLSSVLATFIAIGFAISVQLRRFVN
ncbi:MAG TPA: FtsW/RodA/SpoVE family cell cycle protein [Pyrinomonadaceae bacterium]|jgi:rod shape determining protein RodA|nr:FtsW/RodA/SpoVE family cell cycle protein [Pyrinomonadaceae bacterium]